MTLIAQARQTSGLSQSEVARRAGTSRPTLSAYEHGQRNPTLETLERVLAANGQSLVAIPTLRYEQHTDRRGKPFYVPDLLPRLPINKALATVTLSPHVEWSTRSRPRNLADRRQRMLVYQIILAEGSPEDINEFIDGALLVEAWDELHLPLSIRKAWQPVIDRALESATK